MKATTTDQTKYHEELLHGTGIFIRYFQKGHTVAFSLSLLFKNSTTQTSIAFPNKAPMEGNFFPRQTLIALGM